MATGDVKVKAFQRALPTSPTMESQQAKLRQAADMYEGQFLKQMVKAMRSSVSHSGLTKPGMGEKIYQQNLDQEYVKAWVGRGGIGLSDLIYNQLNEQIFSQRNLARPKGPIPLEDKNNFKIESQQIAPKKMQYKMQIDKEAKQTHLSAPWAGKVSAVHSDINGLSSILLEHDNGLSSMFSYRGLTSPSLLHRRVEAGQNLAQLEAGSNAYFAVQEKLNV